MSASLSPDPDTPHDQRPTRFPTTTYRTFRSFLDQLRQSKATGPIKRPASLKDSSWAQLRATLTALDLADSTLVPTIALRRLARSDQPGQALIDHLAAKYGADCIDRIEAADCRALAEELGLGRTPSERFFGFVRRALNDVGRTPRRSPRQVDHGSTIQTTSANEGSSQLREDLINAEAETLWERCQTAATEGNLDMAVKLQQMFHNSLLLARSKG